MERRASLSKRDVTNVDVEAINAFRCCAEELVEIINSSSGGDSMSPVPVVQEGRLAVATIRYAAAIVFVFGKMRQHHQEIKLVQLKEFRSFGAASIEYETSSSKTRVQFLYLVD